MRVCWVLLWAVVVVFVEVVGGELVMLSGCTGAVEEAAGLTNCGKRPASFGPKVTAELRLAAWSLPVCLCVVCRVGVCVCVCWLLVVSVCSVL